MEWLGKKKRAGKEMVTQANGSHSGGEKPKGALVWRSVMFFVLLIEYQV